MPAWQSWRRQRGRMMVPADVTESYLPEYVGPAAPSLRFRAIRERVLPYSR